MNTVPLASTVTARADVMLVPAKVGLTFDKPSRSDTPSAEVHVKAARSPDGPIVPIAIVPSSLTPKARLLSLCDAPRLHMPPPKGVGSPGVGPDEFGRQSSGSAAWADAVTGGNRVPAPTIAAQRMMPPAVLMMHCPLKLRERVSLYVIRIPPSYASPNRGIAEKKNMGKTTPRLSDAQTRPSSNLFATVGACAPSPDLSWVRPLQSV